jgi:hypothetical protein
MLKQSFLAVVYAHSALNSAFRVALMCLMFFTLFNTSFAQTTNSTSKPQLVPNSRRYKESGLKPASGRSGSASLTGRALLAKDGATTVELSTGQLDTSEPQPGNINKSQIKPLDENGDPLYARNYSNSKCKRPSTVSMPIERMS